MHAIFEGNGNVISGLYINRSTNSYIGLFGEVRTTNAEVRNLGLSNLWVTGAGEVGGLVGYNDEGTITASYVTGTVTGRHNVGGLVGRNNGGTITASYVTGTVTGGDHAGGLVGQNEGTITASYAMGTVSSSGVFVGGLVGRNNGGTITASYATGMVSAATIVGGLVADNAGTIIASYFDTNTTGQTTSAGGTGYTTTQLQMPTNYTGIYSNWNVNGEDPWDFGTTDQYPRLKVDFDGDGSASVAEFGMQATSDAQAVALASNALMIAYTSPDTNSNSVTANVMLATNVGHGVSITWGSSDFNVIAVSGEVTQPAFGETDATVTLTATLNKGVETATKSFMLTELAGEPPPLKNTGNTNLIDITTLGQLNAMRYDLDGNGEIDPNVNSMGSNDYRMAFPGLVSNPNYRGYELMTNLDFAGSVWVSNQSNVEGWDPIGTYVFSNTNASFRAIFEGNGKVISGLYINGLTNNYIGLFGSIRTTNAELCATWV